MATDKNGKTLNVGDRVLVDDNGHEQHGYFGIVTEIIEGDRGPIALVRTSTSERSHAPELRLIKADASK